MFIVKNKYFLIIENIKDIDLKNIKIRNKFSIIYRNKKKIDKFSDLFQFRQKCKNYSYLFSAEDLKGTTVINGCSTHPHHYILEILSEQGLIGLLIFLIFIIFLVKDIIKSNLNKSYVLFLFSIVLGFMLPIKPSGSIISTWFSSIFWLMLSFGYIKNKIFK